MSAKSQRKTPTPDATQNNVVVVPKPKTKKAKVPKIKKLVIEVIEDDTNDDDDVDEDDDDYDDEEDDDEDDEPTEEDLKFIQDDGVEHADVDVAAINPTNIIGALDGGRPKRERKAPDRWIHPDADIVMQKFCDTWNVTTSDIETLLNESVSVPEDEEDESYSGSDDDDDDDYEEDDEDDDDDDEDVVNDGQDDNDEGDEPGSSGDSTPPAKRQRRH
jgi:hypothetical protein